MRAKLAAAAFMVVALLYGSVCSTTCALGACPIETQNAATHDCDHSASVPSHQSDSQNPDCAKHHHPTFDAVKADVQSQLSSAAHANASQMLAVATPGDAAGAFLPTLFVDSAPPPNLNLALQLRNSVLRI